jgi:hypothetical protein
MNRQVTHHVGALPGAEDSSELADAPLLVGVVASAADDDSLAVHAAIGRGGGVEGRSVAHHAAAENSGSGGKHLQELRRSKVRALLGRVAVAAPR